MSFIPRNVSLENLVVHQNGFLVDDFDCSPHLSDRQCIAVVR